MCLNNQRWNGAQDVFHFSTTSAVIHKSYDAFE